MHTETVNLKHVLTDGEMARLAREPFWTVRQVLVLRFANWPTRTNHLLIDSAIREFESILTDIPAGIPVERQIEQEPLCI